MSVSVAEREGESSGAGRGGGTYRLSDAARANSLRVQLCQSLLISRSTRPLMELVPVTHTHTHTCTQAHTQQEKQRERQVHIYKHTLH